MTNNSNNNQENREDKKLVVRERIAIIGLIAFLSLAIFGIFLMVSANIDTSFTRNERLGRMDLGGITTFAGIGGTLFMIFIIAVTRSKKSFIGGFDSTIKRSYKVLGTTMETMDEFYGDTNESDENTSSKPNIYKKSEKSLSEQQKQEEKIMVKCQACGHLNPEDSSYCNYCGSSV